MNSRDFKKWKPFNSVVPAAQLLNSNTKIELPIHSKDEIEEFEEKLKTSMYLKLPIEITFIRNNKFYTVKDYVVKLDSLKKDIYLKDTVINFRQIYKIK